VKNLKFYSFLMLTAFVFMMTACSKKGDTGPAGPTGPAGADGAAGASGTDSIQYSTWTPLSMTGWIDANNDTSYTDTLIAAALTSAVLNQGVVVGYFQFLDNNNDTIIVNASTLISEAYAIGKIELYSGAPQPSTNSSGVDYTGYNYRYVVVPGSIAVTSTTGPTKTYTRDQIKTMSYSTLTHLFNIPPKGSHLKLSSPN
jgi:hypothetical protein